MTREQVIEALRTGAISAEEGRRLLKGLGLSDQQVNAAVTESIDPISRVGLGQPLTTAGGPAAATQGIAPGQTFPTFPLLPGDPPLPNPPPVALPPVVPPLPVVPPAGQGPGAGISGTGGAVPAGAALMNTETAEMTLEERQLLESITRRGRLGLFQNFVNAALQGQNLSPFARGFASDVSRFNPLSAQFALSSAFQGLPFGGNTGSVGLGIPVSSDPNAQGNFAAFLGAQPDAFSRGNFQDVFGALQGFLGQGVGTPEGSAIAALLESNNPEVQNIIASAFGGGLSPFAQRGIAPAVQQALSAFQHTNPNANLFQSFLNNQISGLGGFF